jgi:hypothetical protein
MNIYIVIIRINSGPCFLLSLPISICQSSLHYPFFLLTWRISFLDRGANTHSLLSLVCYRLFTLCHFSHPDTPQRSSYNIYIDDINNISCPVWYNELYLIFFLSLSMYICICVLYKITKHFKLQKVLNNKMYEMTKPINTNCIKWQNA